MIPFILGIITGLFISLAILARHAIVKDKEIKTFFNVKTDGSQFIEPVSFKEKFTNAKNIGDLL